MSTLDIIRPRIFSSPESAESLGGQAIAFCRRVGITLDPEQELMLAAALGVRADGRWQSFEVGWNVPRQNGKGEMLMARELFGLFELGEKFIVHSAHEFKTSERHFQRLESTIRRSPELLSQMKRSDSGRVIGFRYSHGDEAIELQSGGRIEFKTRTRSGMRGFDDVAVLVLDEAMILSEAAHGSMMPTVRASKAERGPQLLYAGSAVDQVEHENGVVWARVRERGISGDDPSLTYAEYSLDYPHPDHVPEEVVSDPAYWRQVNFAIDRGRVLEEHMAREYRSMSLRTFIVELLGVGDWPATNGSGLTAIDFAAWKALCDVDSKIVGPLCLAFDVTPDRSSSSIAACGHRADRLAHAEVIDQHDGTGWVVDALAGYVTRHDPVAVVCDGASPAASMVHDLEAKGVTVTVAKARDHADACGMLVDEVGQETLRHLGQPGLNGAVRGGVKRPLGDAWAWSRKNSRVDISPLVASTLALWGFRTQSKNEVFTAAW